MAVNSIGYFLNANAQNVATLCSQDEMLIESCFILSLSASDIATMVQYERMSYDKGVRNLSESTIGFMKLS